MKIQGSGFDNPNIKKAADKKVSQQQKPAPKKNDQFVKNSGTADQANSKQNTSGVVYAPSNEAPVRIELIDTITERVNSGFYNSPEAIEQFAERLVDSLGVEGLLGRRE